MLRDGHETNVSHCQTPAGGNALGPLPGFGPSHHACGRSASSDGEDTPRKQKKEAEVGERCRTQPHREKH